MTALEAIYGRRSIRRFKPDPVPRELIEKVLEAATKAPSAMNAQPWRFVVLEGEKKEAFITVFLDGINKTRLFKKSAGVKVTAENMRKSPVTILVFNGEKKAGGLVRFFTTAYDTLYLQSIGGAIQTMLLAALELGLGTLWVGHVFYAIRAINRFVGRNEELVAAVALGYPDESPPPRPRKIWAEVTEWLK